MRQIQQITKISYSQKFPYLLHRHNTDKSFISIINIILQCDLMNGYLRFNQQKSVKNVHLPNFNYNYTYLHTQSKTSIKKYMDLGQCFTHATKHVSDIMQYSARYIFRLGKYDQCIMTDHMDYYFIEVGPIGYQDPQIHYGACLPQQCNNNTIKAVMNFALSAAKIPLHVVAVTNKIDQYQYPYNWAFFFTLLMLVILTTLVIVSTISSKSKQSRLLKQFSIQQTTKMFKYHSNSNSNSNSKLNVINGIRSLSMLWVIFGHTMSMAVGYSSNVLKAEQDILGDWKFLIVQAGLYSVDVFFWIGGFILAYALLKEKMQSNMKYPLAVLNRFLRFLPAYFVAIMIYYGLSPHMGNGPFFHRVVPIAQMCLNFWRPLIYVDNFINNGQTMCMGWGWYLQNDMQLFIFCMIVLAIYNKSRFWAFFSIFLTCAANFAFVMAQTYENEEKWMTHISDTLNSARYQLNVYFKPWGRCPPYLYGLLLGILYHEMLTYEAKISTKKKEETSEKVLINDSIKQNGSLTQQIMEKKSEQAEDIPMMFSLKQYFIEHPWHRRACEIIGLAICLFMAFIPRTTQGPNNYWPQFVHSIYLTYGKLAFVFGLSLLTLPSLLLPIDLNKNLLIRYIFDTKAFNFLAKVSFCTYLIHLTLLESYFGSLRIDFYYNYGNTFTIFVGMAVLSVISGVILVYIVEAPFAKVQKKIMSKLLMKSKSRSKKNNKQEEGNKESNKENNKQAHEVAHLNEKQKQIPQEKSMKEQDEIEIKVKK